MEAQELVHRGGEEQIQMEELEPSLAKGTSESHAYN